MKFKTILLGFLAIALIGIAYLLVSAGIRSYRINGKLNEIAALGDPIWLEELGGPPQSGTQANSEASSEIQSIYDEAKDLSSKLFPFLQLETRSSWQDAFTTDEIESLETAFGSHSNVLPALRRAANADCYEWPTATTPTGLMPPNEYLELLMEEAGDLRMVARLMICRARFLASQGQADESAMLAVDLIRLAGLQDSGPTLVVYQVNSAIRDSAIEHLNSVIQSNPLTPQTHTAIEAQLAAHEASTALVHALKTERALGVSMLQSMSIPFLPIPGGIDNYLAVMDEQIRIGRTSPCDQNASIGNTATGLTAAVVPGIAITREAFHRVRIKARCLRILNAMKSQQGSDITQLGLPVSSIRDPYSGANLIVTPQGDRWRIYSVGKDGFDDGGSVEDQKDIGLAARGQESFSPGAIQPTQLALPHS